MLRVAVKWHRRRRAPRRVRRPARRRPALLLAPRASFVEEAAARAALVVDRFERRVLHPSLRRRVVAPEQARKKVLQSVARIEDTYRIQIARFRRPRREDDEGRRVDAHRQWGKRRRAGGWRADGGARSGRGARHVARRPARRHDGVETPLLRAPLAPLLLGDLPALLLVLCPRSSGAKLPVTAQIQALPVGHEVPLDPDRAAGGAARLRRRLTEADDGEAREMVRERRAVAVGEDCCGPVRRRRDECAVGVDVVEAHCRRVHRIDVERRRHAALPRALRPGCALSRGPLRCVGGRLAGAASQMDGQPRLPSIAPRRRVWR